MDKFVEEHIKYLIGRVIIADARPQNKHDFSSINLQSSDTSNNDLQSHNSFINDFQSNMSTSNLQSLEESKIISLNQSNSDSVDSSLEIPQFLSDNKNNNNTKIKDNRPGKKKIQTNLENSFTDQEITHFWVCKALEKWKIGKEKLIAKQKNVNKENI